MVSNQILWILEDDVGAQFLYEETLAIRYQLRFFETIEGFTKAFHTAQETGKGLPALAITDLRLSDGCFLQFLASNNDETLSQIPFLIVSSVDDIDALRFCFQEGALDYIVKPFQKSEIIVKVERAIAHLQKPKVLQSPQPATTELRKLKLPHLTVKENAILSLFMNAKTGEVSRDELIANIWEGITVHPKTLDVHLYNLRKKVSEHGIHIHASSTGKWTYSCDRVNP